MDSPITAPYSDYDAFARAYNAHWGPDYGTKAVSQLRRLLLDKLEPAAKILDLCCGSGHVTQALIKEGYQLTGLDGSKRLLAYAKANAPEATFIRADARSFALPSSYDAVICLNDSLNHVLQLEELAAVFKHVFSVVRCDGSFIFDLNLAHKYETSWTGSFAIVEAEDVCAVRTHYSRDDRLADFTATIFEWDREWKRSDVTLYQTWYTQSEIIESLRGMGFEEIRVLNGEGQELVEEAVDKAFFRCRKRNGG